MDPVTAYYAGTAAVSFLGGLFGSSSEKRAGKAAREAAYANAADALHYAGLNSDIIKDAAYYNADSIRRVGDANANAVLNATYRNLFLYGFQADEEVRRHLLGEKSMAGKIRATAAAGGVQVNTGTPLYWLNSQIDEGIRQRRFMQNKHFYTMLNMKEEGEERAAIIKLTAHENANVVMMNAEAQADMHLLDAERQSRVMIREGDLAYSTSKANASAAMINGLFGAAKAGMGYMAATAPPPGGNTAPFYISSGATPYSSANYQYASLPMPSYY